MTLTRVLNELKTIDNRISDYEHRLDAIGIEDSGKFNKTVNKDEFIKSAKSYHDSITDLIERKRKLKSALMKANSTHTVKVNGEEMTIMDAIFYKEDYIAQLKKYLAVLTNQWTTANIAFSSAVERNENVLNSQIQNMLGKDNSGSKGDATAVSEYTKVYNENHKVEFVDPLNLKRLIDELKDKIDTFSNDVDASLSEVNATIKVLV